jgi:predicted component of type VI protein secretion system
MSAVDRADGLEGELEKLLQDAEALKKLAGEMGVEAAATPDNKDGGST